MKIDFQNFFKYYDENLKHHVEAVSQLEAEIDKLDSSLLTDDAEWVQDLS